ncbi:MAG: LacI family DNA-binding transcriptional regulator [Sedimentisphaerales bacterium]|nr:LacI family DNA-binding transcriptional regulator [Sedimentisphaerales bacterium]
MTLQAIASRLGVSVTTVSRVLNGRARQYRISEKTEQAVLAVADKHHYAPNHLARSLRINKTFTLGLVIPDISNPFFAGLARHVEGEARGVGYAVLLCDSEENTAIELESLRLLQGRKVDGIIICPVGRRGEHLERLYRQGLPLVVVDRYFPRRKLPYVTSDNFGGAFSAVTYLIEKGHRRIACIQGIPDSASNRDRVAGYQKALDEHGLLAESCLVGDHFGERNGYIQTKLLLQRTVRPTAVFAAGNLITLGCLQALAEEGLRVPEDMSIISFDDQPYFAFLATPLTSVAQRYAAMGEIAVQRLLNQIDTANGQAPEGIVLPTEFRERGSVKILRES